MAYEGEAAKGGAEVDAVHAKRAPFDCQPFGAPSLAGDANKPGPADRTASGMHFRPQGTILLHFIWDSNDLAICQGNVCQSHALENNVYQIQKLALAVCPSGLRGWAQVAPAQAAWAQIPQLPNKYSQWLESAF